MSTPVRAGSLAELPVSPGTRQQLAALAQAGDIDGAIVYFGPEPDENTRVAVFGPGSHRKTLESALDGLPSPARFIWTRVPPAAKPRRALDLTRMGRTARALQLLEQNPKLAPHAAAVEAGVDSSAVYRALKRRNRAICPHCGRYMPAGTS